MLVPRQYIPNSAQKGIHVPFRRSHHKVHQAVLPGQPDVGMDVRPAPAKVGEEDIMWFDTDAPPTQLPFQEEARAAQDSVRRSSFHEVAVSLAGKIPPRESKGHFRTRLSTP